MSDADAFEAALAANPDDLATYSAYADWLQERDDPRGEFIAVQLALEDETRAGAARDLLKAREAELLATRERAWLGPLAPHLLDAVDQFGNPRPAVEHWWGRGFVSEMRVHHFTFPLARAVAEGHATRFLRKLHIEYAPPHLRLPPATRPGQPTLLDYLGTSAEIPDAQDESSPLGTMEQAPYFELIGAPCIRSLRVFQFGADADHAQGSDGWTERVEEARGLEHLIASMPRIEELYLLCGGYDAHVLFALPNLSHLQVLRVYGLGESGGANPAIPLHALARNPALGALTHLIVHPRFTRERQFLPVDQVRALVNSPHLAALSHLQLRLSDMGDDGVAAIVGSGILKRLGWLDLRNGTITDVGARAFAECAAARNLRRLDLSRNAVTSIGADRLKRAHVNVVINNARSKREQDALDAQRREDDRREAEME